MSGLHLLVAHFHFLLLNLAKHVWLLYLMGAAVFEWPVTGILNTVMGLFMIYFVVMVGLLIWVRAPKENR